MKGKKKEFKVFSKRQPIYKPFRLIMKLIYKKPKIINLAGEIADRSIIVANHSAKSGPPCLDLYFPKKTAKWGAHEMLGNYNSRRKYLRDILYIKKCKAKPFSASVKATILAFPSPWVYKGMWMMGTYTDGRLISTVKNSIKVLESDIPVMIFPENSNEGYKTVLTELFPGFVVLSTQYYKKHGVDLPIYPTYYHVKKRVLVIGKPMKVNELYAQGLDRNAICEKFCHEINSLYHDYVEKND